jgi:hypothetical protein
MRTQLSCRRQIGGDGAHARVRSVLLLQLQQCRLRVKAAQHVAQPLSVHEAQPSA